MHAQAVDPSVKSFESDFTHSLTFFHYIISHSYIYIYILFYQIAQAVEPSDKSLEAEGDALLAEMRADARLKQQVAAVKQVCVCVSVFVCVCLFCGKACGCALQAPACCRAASMWDVRCKI